MGGAAAEKIGMKLLFDRPNRKADGSLGKLRVMDPVEQLQSGAETRWRWVRYAAMDARATWELYGALRTRLESEHDVAPDAAVGAEYAAAGAGLRTLWDVYARVWRPFGQLLTDMEALGVAVDRGHLAAAEERALADQDAARVRFRDWARARVPGAAHMNSGSSAQVTQLLFAGAANGKDAAAPGVPLVREFKARVGGRAGGWGDIERQ